MSNPEHFLPEKYPDLPGSLPVSRAVSKSLVAGEHGAKTKHERVDRYLNRIEKIVALQPERKSKSGRPLKAERGFELLKNKILNKFTIDTANEDAVAKIAEGLYESEKRIAIEQGRATEADLERLGSTAEIVQKYQPLVLEKAEIQRKTLSDWLDYLQANDAKHPMWFRYFVVRGLDKMGVLDQEKFTYSKRTPRTVAPFPELNSEALGWVYQRLTEDIEPEYYVPRDEETARKKDILTAAINAKDFSKLYAFAQIETAGKLNRESIEGEWRKYEQGSDPVTLEDDLKGKGTGWCTATGSAAGHLEAGDFYVYYSKSQSGYTEPRVAIRMEGDQVAEVRGVNQRQELEPELVAIAQAQYHGLPGGEQYDKKAADVTRLSAIYDKCFRIDQKTKDKTYLNPTLTKDELIFLYEIKEPIESFGYDKHPRIKEIRDRRNSEADAPVVFDCAPNQIAHTPNEIIEDTKAYIGLLVPNIFKTISHLDHIYTKFPEGRIRQESMEIDKNKTPAQYLTEFKKLGIKISDYAKHMLERMGIAQDKEQQVGLVGKIKKGIFGQEPKQTTEQVDIIRLTVADLGFPNGATKEQIYQKREELGLELCPAEVGPQYRLQYINQPMNEWVYVGMDPISDPDGRPHVFDVGRGADGVYLSNDWARPDDHWVPDDLVLFRLRK